MARRLRAPRIPGTGPRGPRHNQFNRQTKESRQREKMLDGGKQNYFKYALEDLLKTSPVPEEHHMSLIQSLWAKGSRTSLSDAKTFLKEKVDEGLVDRPTEKKILDVMDRYSTWR